MSDPHLDLLDDARLDAAVAERTQRRRIAEADDLDATFEASLRTIAATGAVVLADTTVGRSLRGRIDAVGDEHLVVAEQAATSYVRVDQVTALRALHEATPRAVPSVPLDRATRASLTSLLADLAVERTRLDVHLVGGAVVRGELRRAGADVLTIASAHDGAETLVNLRLAAVLTVHHGPD